MAQRPVFIICNASPYVRLESVDFKYFSGFSDSQQRKSIQSLHDAFLARHADEKILEISSKSDIATGIEASAFNLTIHTLDNKSYSVESAFQSSKVFERGGPYKDLLGKPSREAKKDIRLKESGKLVSFYFSKKTFPLSPATYFYNWLYINALYRHQVLADEIIKYTAFTDIAFNPNKSINCQACSAAVFVSLKKCGLLEKALKSPESFLNVVYGKSSPNQEDIQEQLNIWDFYDEPEKMH